MLVQNELIDFFSKHDIPLEGTKSLTTDEIDRICLAARDLGLSFAGFIRLTVVNGDWDGITTHFSSEDELYDSYCTFMVGFSSTTSANN